MWLPERYSAQHYLLVVIEKFKEAIDRGNEFAALLTDLSKTFDWINYPLLIAKMYNYGVSLGLLTWIFPIWAIDHIEPKLKNTSGPNIEQLKSVQTKLTFSISLTIPSFKGLCIRFVKSSETLKLFSPGFFLPFSNLVRQFWQTSCLCFRDLNWKMMGFNSVFIQACQHTLNFFIIDLLYLRLNKFFLDPFLNKFLQD